MSMLLTDSFMLFEILYIVSCDELIDIFKQKLKQFVMLFEIFDISLALMNW